MHLVTLHRILATTASRMQTAVISFYFDVSYSPLRAMSPGSHQSRPDNPDAHDLKNTESTKNTHLSEHLLGKEEGFHRHFFMSGRLFYLDEEVIRLAFCVHFCSNPNNHYLYMYCVWIDQCTWKQWAHNSVLGPIGVALMLYITYCQQHLLSNFMYYKTLWINNKWKVPISHNTEPENS